nr:uncharacterized protein LOC128676295 [Plodia interpunctella]
MVCPMEVLFIFSLISIVRGTPIFLTGSSPSGDAVIAISSDNPDVEKYLRFGFSKLDNTDDAIVTEAKTVDDNIKSVAVSSRLSPEANDLNTGRSFASSSFNPFLLPFFFSPLNLEGIGLANSGSWNWQKGVEGYYDPALSGNGQITTVAAVNDNGRIFGNVKTVNIENKS